MINIAATFNFVIPDQLLARLKNVAERKNVSVASIINTLITEHLDETDRLTALEKRVTQLENEIKKMKGEK